MIDSQSLYAGLSTREPDQSTVDLLNEFKSELKRENVPLDSCASYFDALATCFEPKICDDELEKQIQELALATACHLSRRILLQDSSKIPAAAPVLGALFDYLTPEAFSTSDSDTAVTGAAPRAARALADMWLASPETIDPAVRQYGFAHSKADNREAAVLLLKNHLEVAGPKFQFRKFTPVITHLLVDRDADVRKAAQDVLVSFFSKAPPRAKQDLEREMKRQRVPPPLASNILNAVGCSTATESPTAALSTSSSTGVSQNSTKAAGQPLIDTIIASPQFPLQNLEPLDVDSVADFKQKVESFKPCFHGKETERNWEARERAVTELRRMIRGNILDKPGDIVWALKQLSSGIHAAITSLRTTLCTAALQLVKECFQLLKTYMDPLIDPYMSYLIQVCKSTKKITASLAHVAVCSLILNTSMSAKVLYFIHQVMSDKIPTARVYAFQWLHVTLVVHSPEIKFLLTSTGGEAIVEGDLKKGLSDAAAPVREAARPVFWLFATLFPVNAEAMGAKLDPQAKKQLLRAQPKELYDAYDHNFALKVIKNSPTTTKQLPKAPADQSRPPSRPVSRVNSDVRQPASSSASISTAKSVSMLPPKERCKLAGNVQVTDVIRRMSRALSETRVAEATDALETAAALENISEQQNKPTLPDLGSLSLVNDNTEGPADENAPLIDDMPPEPTAASKTTGSNESAGDEDKKDPTESSETFATVSAPSANQATATDIKESGDKSDTNKTSSSPVPSGSKDTEEQKGQNDNKSTVDKHDTEAAEETVPEQSDLSNGDPKPAPDRPELPPENFGQGELIAVVMGAARDAVSETMSEQGLGSIDLNNFSVDQEINSASDFKETLKNKLNNTEGIEISIETVLQKTAEKVGPRLEEYMKQYPESKDAIEEAAKLVEQTAREKKKSSGDGDADATQKADSKAEGEENTDTEDKDEEAADGAIGEAVKEVNKKMDDGEDTADKLGSLADLLDSDDVETMTMGVNVLSYVLRGKKPPKESVSGLGSLVVPPPDLIGKALNYLFEQAMDKNPEVKELLSRFTSPDLVQVALQFVGQAVVMWVAVHLLPAEVLMLSMRVLTPLLNVGAVVDTLFEIATSDDVSEAALMALGGLLTGFDKIPMNEMLRGKAKAVLEVVYRLGDLSGDVTNFLADWIGFDSDSDSSSDSDDDSDEEKIAEHHAERFEKNMAARTPAAVAGAISSLAMERDICLHDSDPDNDDVRAEEGSAIFAEAISSEHPVSISYRPVSGGTKAVRRFKIHTSSTLDRDQSNDFNFEEHSLLMAFPESESASFTFLEKLTSELEQHTISKKALVTLIRIIKGGDEPIFQTWDNAPAIQQRVEKASLIYTLKKLDEEKLILALLLIRTLLDNGGFSSSVEHLKVLECLASLSCYDLPQSVEHAALPQTRDLLLKSLVNVDSEVFYGCLISVFQNEPRRASRLFALRTIRQIISRTKFFPADLQDVVTQAVTDKDLLIRQEAYPILLNIHMQSKAASDDIKQKLTKGQQRLFEYYCEQT